MRETGRGSPWTPRRGSVVAWVLYDLANTTFALGVGSRYFGLWLIEERGGADWHLSAATIVAMLTVIVVAPWVGMLTDHGGRRVPYLTGATLVCVGATALLATWGIVPSLVFYAIGMIGFHVGASVYDALLADVSTPVTRGRVSGAGVAVGYGGSALALALGAWLLPLGGHAAVFRGLATALLVFALPAFFFIRERPRLRQPGRPPGLSRAPGAMIRVWRDAAAQPGVVRFLVGRFLYTDAINTVFLFNAVYAKLELGFSDVQTDRLAILGIACAAVGAALAGKAVDRFGPRKVLLTALYAQLAGLLSAVAASALGLPALGWFVAVGGGAGVGAAWASDRVFMTRLAPPASLGRLFGLYAAVGRFATVLGPLVWALVADGLGWGRTAALATLTLFLVGARIVLHRTDDTLRYEEDAS